MDDNTRDGIVAIVSGVITALLSWFGMVLRLKSRDRKREEDRSDREEAMRIGALGEANVRLFDELKRQIAELKTECEECNRGKAEIFAHVIAQQAWMIKVEAVMREKGIYIEKPPMISPKMAMDGSM